MWGLRHFCFFCDDVRIDIGLVKGVIGVHEEVPGSCRERDLSLVDSGVPCFLLLFPCQSFREKFSYSLSASW